MRRRFSLGVELLCERLTLDASAITVVIPVLPPGQLPTIPPSEQLPTIPTAEELPTIPIATLILDPWYDYRIEPFDPMDPNYRNDDGPVPWFDPMGV